MAKEIDFSFERPISAADLQPLFRQTHWAAQRSNDAVESLLACSGVTLGGWHNDRLVAFARALTDDHFRALVDDVVVDHSFRDQGLGTALMRHMAQRLAQVEEVFLRCDPEMVSFYERLGYRQRLKCMDLITE
jgi:GNAT superfamily N-acetyltransferase